MRKGRGYAKHPEIGLFYQFEFGHNLCKDYQQINFNTKIRNFVELIEDRNELKRTADSRSGNLTFQHFLEDQIRFASLLIL